MLLLFMVMIMFKIGRTEYRNTNQPHKHSFYEILLYIEGKGTACTSMGNYRFAPGSILIIPPGVTHSTKSESGSKSLYINGDFEQILNFKEPVILNDNEKKEGLQLAAMLYNNRLETDEFLSHLCSSFMYFVLKNTKPEDRIYRTVNKIKYQISDKFYDADLSLKKLLRESGYAQDYIRYQFKKITDKTPNEFLTETRIKHACFLIERYENSLSLMEISEQCGYTDYVYFSKRFKQLNGESPKKYKEKICNQNIG